MGNDEGRRPEVKAYLWHLKGKWDSVMERVERGENGPPSSIKQVHEKYLRGCMGWKGLVSKLKKSV